MSRQIVSLNHSLSYPLNLKCHSQVLPPFDFPPYPEPSITSNSSSMDSDNISTNTVFHTISHFNNSGIETPDELVDSEPSPSTFSQRPFQPIHTQIADEPSSAPPSDTEATPINPNLQRPT